MPSANKIDQAKLKRELEKYGRKFGLCGIFEMTSELLQLRNLDLSPLGGEIIGHRGSF